MKSISPLAIYEPGQRVGEPTKPLSDYPEYHSRTIPWLKLAEEADALVASIGPEAALEEFNRRLEIPLFQTMRRHLPELGQVVVHGLHYSPGGCQWKLKSRGGCTFCEFQETVDQMVGSLKIREAEFTALVMIAMSAFRHLAAIVRFFTAGSGLNPGEIPVGTMHALARQVATAPTTKILGVESRVQFINEETLAQYGEILFAAGKSLEVMIGFEVLNDEIRNGPALNKGMTRVGFEKGVRVIRDFGARAAAYAMLMPISMTERQAVDGCLETHRYLAGAGVSEIMLQARYSHHEHIQSPKLWSIAHVLWESRGLGVPVTLGDWVGEMPEPKVWPKNCGVCDDAMLAVLDRYRETLDPSVVDPKNLPSCECRKPWEESIGL